jgi:hypothetical protein
VVGVGDFELVGSGLTVYEDDRVIEGPLRWLDSPAAVIDFVNSGRAGESIVLARGGTTTFLSPALTSGVKGVLTLQGAPESHLGILSREYGIPCLMSVAFTSGVRSTRGELIPADGTIVRMDVSGSPRGQVYAEPGAVAGADQGADQGAYPDPDPAAQGGPTPEEQAQVQHLLHNYLGETPHGSAGDQLFRRRIGTNVLITGDDDRDLSRDELNDLLGYMGFNLWDCLALRATEGESGLIPRQEYEAFGAIQIWQRYPELLRFITDEIGVDGLHRIGGTSRREIGTKANMLHNWCIGFTLAIGRGIGVGLGQLGAHEREADLRDGLQFTRRLYAGLRGGPGQPMFSSMNGYVAPVLDGHWLTRFEDEVVPVTDRETRSRYQRFSANTELMGFLLHFDNRCGLHDTGPYPTADGGFVIVRDHFLSDDLYHWADVAEDLPHAITQAMFFKPDAPLEVSIGDLGTVFTKPANYLRHLTGMAVYARDRWDTPVSEIRRLDDAEIDRIGARCQTATTQLYKRIATMSKRDKIMAGAQVYYTDFLAPFARAAGLWDRLKTEFDFFEIDPVASAAYYDLVPNDGAARTVPRLLLTGAGFPPVRDPVSAEEAMAALHLLALRGCCAELPVPPADLAGAGLVSRTPAGYLLTDAGRAMHERGLAEERKGFDSERMGQAYERFLALNGPMKAAAARWQSADEDARFELLGELADLVGRVKPALRRTAEQLPRFELYLPRLRKAMSRAEQGELDYVVNPTVDSVHTVWMELHEDYLLTQGISREQEGSY